MILGMIAATQSSEPASGNPYGDALAVLDFESEIYWIGNTQVTLADLIDRPSLRVAGGLYCDWDLVDSFANATQAVIDILATLEWTLVLEWTETAAAVGFSIPLWLNTPSTGTASDFFVDSGATNVVFYDQPTPGTDRDTNCTGIVSAETGRRIAVTRTNAALQMSANGQTVVDAALTSSTGIVEAVGIGGEPGADPSDFASMQGYIRSLIIYPARDSSLLPTLSALTA